MRADAGETLLALLLHHPEAFIAPQPPDTLVVHLPARPAGFLGGASTPPPRATIREVAEERSQLGLLVSDRWWRETLRRPVQPDDGAGSTFGHPEPFTQHRDGAALAVRGQKFRSATSSAPAGARLKDLADAIGGCHLRRCGLRRRLDHLAMLLPDLVAAAVDCPEEPWLGPAEVGDMEIRFRQKSRYDVGDLRIVIEVPTKWMTSRLDEPQRRADSVRDGLAVLNLETDRCLADPR